MSEFGTDQTVDPLARFWETLCRTGAIKILLFMTIAINIYHASTARSERHQQQDFAHYYASSLLWLEGESVYQTNLGVVYDRLGWETFDEEIFQATNPPALVAMFAPFAKLNPQTAHFTWMLMQILSLAVAIWFTWICLNKRISFDGFAFVLSIFLLLPFLSSHLFYSQVQLVILAIVVVAYCLTITSGEKCSGGIRIGSTVACGLVAFATLLKVFPLVLLPWFIWRSHTKMLHRFTAAIAALVVLCLGVQLLGTGLWSDFIEFGLPTVSRWIKAGYECFTLGNATHQFAIGLGGDPTSNIYVRIGTLVGAILLVMFYLRLLFLSGNTRTEKHFEFALLVLLMLFCGGTCWWHYLVFLLFPFQVIASEIKNNLKLPILASSGLVLLLFANIQLPVANSGTLTTVINQRPLIGMLLMATFLAWKLNRVPHSGSQNVKMDSPTVTES